MGWLGIADVIPQILGGGGQHLGMQAWSSDVERIPEFFLPLQEGTAAPAGIATEATAALVQTARGQNSWCCSALGPSSTIYQVMPTFKLPGNKKLKNTSISVSSEGAGVLSLRSRTVKAIYSPQTKADFHPSSVSAPRDITKPSYVFC